IMGKSLSYFSDFNNQMMTSMMIFSILSLALAFPLLVFKNGTVLSLITMILSFMFICVTIGLFGYGMSCHLEFLKPYKEMDRLVKEFGTTSNTALLESILAKFKEFYQIAIS
ncbi:MAG: hypothetical protein ACRC4L_01125, partial [Mycoplasma sp.]